MELTRITLEYVPLEDRMRMTGRTPEGAVVVLWLTQRLFARLLVRLFPLLVPPGPPGAAAPAADAPQQAEAQAQLHAMAQEAARLEQKPLEPVSAQVAVRQCLVHNANLNVELRRMRIGWCHKDEEVAWMALTPEGLRKWLNIVHDAWREAGWPAGLWPQWMQQAAAGRGGPRKSVH